MSCPTCSHTMKSIGEARGEPVFYCWRCGTIKDSIAVEVPYLVRYVQRLFDQAVDKDLIYQLYHRGILTAAGRRYDPEEETGGDA